MRNAQVDSAKGIGILLVVIGHGLILSGQIDSVAAILIYTFHMPLFFFLSGQLWKDRPLKKRLVSRFCNLIIPYAIFCILLSLYYLCNGCDLQDLVYSIAYGRIGFFVDFPFSPLWFLPCLFCSSLIFHICRKITFSYLLIGIIGVALAPYKLPWEFDVSMVAIIFMMAGSIFKDTEIPWQFLVVTLIFCAALNGRPEMGDAVYHNPALFILGGIAGSMLMLRFPFGFFSIFGRHSLAILGLHGTLLLWGISLTNTIIAIVAFLAYSIAIIAICEGVGWIRTHYSPIWCS